MSKFLQVVENKHNPPRTQIAPMLHLSGTYSDKWDVLFADPRAAPRHIQTLSVMQPLLVNHNVGLYRAMTLMSEAQFQELVGSAEFPTDKLMHVPGLPGKWNVTLGNVVARRCCGGGIHVQWANVGDGNHGTGTWSRGCFSWMFTQIPTTIGTEYDGLVAAVQSSRYKGPVPFNNDRTVFLEFYTQVWNATVNPKP